MLPLAGVVGLDDSDDIAEMTMEGCPLNIKEVDQEEK